MVQATEKEYKSRINTVIDHILKNLNSDVSLEALSKVANYSPFHLQKVFKQVTGETPKQYVIKIKLEAAFHSIIIHPHKSLLEVSMDFGFSSAAVFSRAMKNYFGIPPEKIRDLSPREHLKFLKLLNLHQLSKTTNHKPTESKVTLIKSETLKGIYVLAPFNDPTMIGKAFNDLLKIAQAHDLYNSESEFYGILSSQHGHTYKAFLSISTTSNLPGKLNCTEIKAGKYAVSSALGQMKETINAVHFIFNKWLPDSGYKVADPVIGYETFSSDPTKTVYEEIERHIHIPVKPV